MASNKSVKRELAALLRREKSNGLISLRTGSGISARSNTGGHFIRARRKHKTTATPCPFGQLIVIPTEGETPAGKGIRGGIVYAGDQNWNVEAQPIDLGVDGEFLVWLEVGVTCNVEDDLPLPGLDTSTAPTWELGTVAGGYPDMTQPDGTDPTGTAIVPLGTLTIADGAATFVATACGDVRIGYCPTNLSVDRINTIIVESPYYYY